MQSPVNWWGLAGVVLNFVGTMVLLGYSAEVLYVHPSGHLLITYGTWATSLWWWYGGLGLNILGYVCQFISYGWGGQRRAPPPAGTAHEGPSPVASLPSTVTNSRSASPTTIPACDRASIATRPHQIAARR
jgi:hypothetical protein